VLQIALGRSGVLGLAGVLHDETTRVALRTLRSGSGWLSCYFNEPDARVLPR